MPTQDAVHRLGRLLQFAFAQQTAEVARQLSLGILDGEGEVPRLEYWPEHLARVLKPTMTQLFHQGIVNSRKRLKQLGISFDLFDPRVLRAVDKATLQFCEETNDTAVADLSEAVRKLRQLLKRGLERGKAVAQLAREVKRIFADPGRAFRIAVTETSRAVHAGGLFNAKESTLELRKEWVASSDACDACLELDGVQRELDEPFAVEGTGSYARIMHPPRHPHCLCTFIEVIAA